MGAVTARQMVLETVGEAMTWAFSDGRMLDAQNMNRYITVLERMTDEESDQTGTVSEPVPEGA